MTNETPKFKGAIDYELAYKLLDEILVPRFDAKEVCLMALRKQIKRKPFVVSGKICCSVCGDGLDGNNYCEHCGQAVDWSKDE